MNSKTIITTGAIFMALAVALGAFGAHIVQDMLTPDRFDVYQTAVEYHFYHALGLLLLGAITFQIPHNKWLSLMRILPHCGHHHFFREPICFNTNRHRMAGGGHPCRRICFYSWMDFFSDWRDKIRHQKSLNGLWIYSMFFNIDYKLAGQ